MTDEDQFEEDNETVLRLRDAELDWLDVDEDVVILDSDRAVYLGTNPSGALLWRALSKGATASELVELLVDEFEINPELAKTDTRAFVDSLRERGLLRTD